MTEQDLEESATKGTPPVLNVPPVVLVVIVVLLGIHGALQLLGPDWQTYALYLFSFIPSRLGGGEAIPMAPGSQVWTFVTYAFLHGDWVHVGSNCVWLLIFSTPVARRLGTLRYLALLAISAVAGAVAMLPMNWGQFLFVVGASASVSGAMAAAMPIMYAPGFHRQADVAHIIVQSPSELLRNRNALIFTAVFIALQLFTGSAQSLSATAFLDERNIAWEAHIGGFLAGLICFYRLDRISRTARRRTVL